MSKYFTFYLALLLLGSPAFARKPNVLILYIDDLGWKDTGFMGSDFYETPHLDTLAAGGMVFTDAYAGAANCAPSRACLLSGQYSPRHEIYNVGTAPRGNARDRKLAHVPGTETLRPDIKTWAQCARDAGYRTASMGKWHLSDDPVPYGFDVNVGGAHSGSPPKGYFPPHGKVEGLGDAPEGEYVTDRLSSEAVRFITENKEGRWLLYLTHFAVHTPLQGKAEDVAYFEAKKPGVLHQNAVMAAMIKSVDDGVGKIVGVLDELGIREETAILFTSDNGGYGPATSMNPLKGYKGSYYEGGIRVPFFANWPGVTAPGSRCSEPVTAVDLFPTIIAMTGGSVPGNQPADGVSLIPLFSGQPIAERALYWHFPAYLQSYKNRSDGQRDPIFRTRPCSIIRRGPWKLHEYFEDGALELYHLQDDIGETNDLSESHPEQRETLSLELKAWRSATGAPVPERRRQ